MIKYDEIQERIDADFDNYLTALLRINDNPRKYFYWSYDFFRVVGGLSFQYFTLSEEQKDEINKIGAEYFDSEDVYFEVNKNSHRHDLLIKNIDKLFESSVSNQKKRYEYLKEFIFWNILQKIREKLLIEINDLKGKFSDSEKKESDKKKDNLNYILNIVKKQKDNYLITYITFLLDNTNNPTFKPFANYIKYTLTKKGEDLIKKLDELDRESIYDLKSKKEIKQQTHDFNPELRKKIENLYILKEEESKLHFVFTRNQGGGKEELRELLDIMGKDDTGNLYRGQADASWTLDASITREPKYLESEGDMYYDILSLKPDAFQNDKTVYDRLITMQHFGMPTRLMDITRNPLVSIFFACNNLERKESDGVIFTFKPENKSDFLNFENKKLEDLSILFNNGNNEKNEIKEEAKVFLEKIWFIRGVAKNQRINNQSGDFIFVGNGVDLKEKLYQLPKMTIVIDSKSKEVLLEQLESLNIHGGSVYPDLTHMSTYIKHKYLNDSKTKTIGEVTQKQQPEIVKAVKQKTKHTKATNKEVLVQPFDFTKIKGKPKDIQLNTFSKFYNLERIGLEKLADEILFTGKPPLRDEVNKVMTQKPALKERAILIDSLTEKIITLTKIIGAENQ